MNPSEHIRLEGTQSHAAKILWQRRPPLHDRNDLAQRRDGEVPEERWWPLPRRSVGLPLLPARDEAQAGSERAPHAADLGFTLPLRICRAVARVGQYTVELDELAAPVDLVGLPRDLRAQFWLVEVLEGELALAPVHNRGVVVGREAPGASEERPDGLPELQAVLVARLEVGTDGLVVDAIVAPECILPCAGREGLHMDLLVNKPLSTEPVDAQVVVLQMTTFVALHIEEERQQPKEKHRVLNAGEGANGLEHIHPYLRDLAY